MKSLIMAINKPKLSYKKFLLISVTLAGLSGCNGGNNSAGVSAQDSSLSKFEQRRAIVVKQIKNGESVVIPAQLKTFSELNAIQNGSFGSMLGKPALFAVGGDALLSSDPCIIMKDDFKEFSHRDNDSYFEIKKVTSNDSTMQSRAISASLAVGYGLGQVSASSDIKNSALFSRSSLGFNFINGVRGTHSLAPGALDVGSLAKFFKPENLTLGSLNSRFFKFCGDSYVSEEAFKAEVKGSLVIDFENEASASDFTSKIGGSYSSFADVSTAINKAESSSHVKGTVTLTLSQTGGVLGNLSQAIDPSSALSCSLEDFAACGKTMEKLLAYAGTLHDQIYDSESKLIKSNLAYELPKLTRYSKMILISNKDVSPRGASAIAQLNLFYLDTLKLHYALEKNQAALSGDPLTIFQNKVLGVVNKREKYIAAMSSTCYEDPDLCADKLLPTLFSDINRLYPFDMDMLRFYTKMYLADNFMNINGKFGSMDNSGHITITLVPNLMYKSLKTGVVTYSYINSKIPNCASSLCEAGSITSLIEPVESIPNVNYRISMVGYSNLRYDCDENKATKGLSCKGYNYSIRDNGVEQKGKYTWKDNAVYSYVGGLSLQELEQYAQPGENFGK